ncbi:MAG TPA: hypothetical protein VFR24_09880 [Candidatus Angelobacter sp.]|nr:hypothetical protein [Candidatus Angelobacter sp.]
MKSHLSYRAVTFGLGAHPPGHQGMGLVSALTVLAPSSSIPKISILITLVFIASFLLKEF